jgi:hypothetical protein
MTEPNDKLARTARRLLRNPERHFVELLGVLRQLHDTSRPEFVDLIEKSSIPVQGALDLVKFDRVVASADFPVERLRQIGLNKVLLIAPLADTPEKAVELLHLAETQGLHDLRAIISGNEAEHGEGPEKTSPGPHPLTSFIVRLDGVGVWTEYDILEAREKLQRELNRLLIVKGFAAGASSPKQRITAMPVFLRGPAVPENGLRAKQMGVAISDNPFLTGTRQHARWRKKYDTPEWPSSGE